MRQIESAKSSTFTDPIWRIAYRLGFPLARIWWRLSGQRHEGALVAVQIKGSLLLLRSSYRSTWNFPGGSVRPDETPERAARRELVEEIGLATQGPLIPAGEASGVWDGRRDRVHFFALRLATVPLLRLDNREIVGTRLASPAEALALPLTEPVRTFIEGLRARLRMVVAARFEVIQARDVDPREPWPNGRDCPQDEAISV